MGSYNKDDNCDRVNVHPIPSVPRVEPVLQSHDGWGGTRVTEELISEIGLSQRHK